jgi:hypothetical protein
MAENDAQHQAGVRDAIELIEGVEQWLALFLAPSTASATDKRLEADAQNAALQLRVALSFLRPAVTRATPTQEPTSE